MNMNPPPARFTVIIPTKDRAPYLRETLRTCSMQDYEPLDILVSDDGSEDETREVVAAAAARDPRIQYLSPRPAAGMRDNFEFVLGRAKPGFVIALGGDDGLLPGGIKGMHEVLRETGTELLSWPAPVFSYPRARGGKGQLSFYRRRGVERVDARRFLRRQAGRLHYLGDVESPMFYVKGVAATRLIDLVRKRSPGGRFYSCPTPDGYSGIVLAGEVDEFAFSGRPFSIFGLSPASQGLAYLSDDARGLKASREFFKSDAAAAMHRELASQPYSPLITLMTADYLLTARDLPGWPGTFPPLDYRRLLKQGLGELGHGLYGDERLGREIKILNEIAEAHGLGEDFRRRLSRARRRRKKSPYEGSGLSPRAFFLDAEEFRIANIFDAAQAVQYLYPVYERARLGPLFRLAAGSLAYYLRGRGRGRRFPPESEWRNAGPSS